MGQAPVCHVSVDQVINQPASTPMPSIPPATDLSSALQAIAALTQLVNQLSGRFPSNSGNNKNSKQKVGRFQELKPLRTVEKKRIFNPQDKEQFVDVERINRLVFQDTVTGEQWTWTR